LLPVCSLTEIGKMKSYKFQMCCYSSCEAAQVYQTPFVSPLRIFCNKFVLPLFVVLDSFISQLVLSFSCL